ncbi:hypothetical protein FisN_9Hh038 [Fistulifera solaris]|uniref:Uncharacterized protein n=1 Tax=Fistulifera solaris TaxID=1519565 RepID=A0A1Z5K2C0_FISSO|nr:hypothetical protein FisN_9Hh038 [Fistulifera solaris]|eukprot:GAX20329.1 hypothetical protein FisN_9Hh038 [Fistulifera solaris]
MNETWLDWSDQQRRILTANGKAEYYYCAARGFPFHKQELPHTFFGKHSSDEFQKLLAKLRQQSCPIIGVWNRPLFVGEWEHSTDDLVYNIQTNAWFIDLRIPLWRLGAVFASSYQDLTGTELRLLARQHVFGGLTVCHTDKEHAPSFPHGFCGYATRYHTMDWNYLGNRRNRPNRWWIEPMPRNDRTWKEYSYAKNDAGQYYYWERWESAVEEPPTAEKAKNAPIVLALQRCGPYHGLIVVVGDHFNYCFHNVTDDTLQEWCQQSTTSPQHIIDDAVGRGGYEEARRVLSRMNGGHGRIQPKNAVQTEWRIDVSTEPWKHGTLLWEDVQLVGDPHDTATWRIHGNGEEWKVVECNLTCMEELESWLP